MLRDAVACVLGQERTPATLRWTRLGESGSFEAVSNCQHLYSINTLDGEVLLDGFPPGRLPKDILNHPLYKRCFATQDFEVARTNTGVLQTTKPYAGRLYDFIIEGDNLRINETDIEQDVELQLLDVGSDGSCSDWGPDLPDRLKELHSHWIDRQRQVLVFRPTLFKEHDTHFLAKSLDTGGGLVGYQCVRVPPHLRGVPWRKLLDDAQYAAHLTDMLVLPSSTVHAKTVISKFEDPAYIHAFVAVPGGVGAGDHLRKLFKDGCTLLWVLPRYHLEFRQHQSGTPLSVDYQGYRLAACQQLASAQHGAPQHLCRIDADSVGCDVTWYTLPEFRKYLVLERSDEHISHNTAGARRADVMIIVPRGPVTISMQQVTVQCPPASGDKCQVHKYEFHPRFGYLQASSKLARLQLAALYAATSSLLPEPLSGATGAQTALQLIRMNWSNVPLTKEEHQQLTSIPILGGHHCSSLGVLAHELLLSSEQLGFLHHDLDEPRPKLQFNTDVGNCYLQEMKQQAYKGWVSNPRSLLEPEEEYRALGGMRSQQATAEHSFRDGRCHMYEVASCPVGADVVPQIENEILGCVSHSPPVSPPAYPLNAQNLLASVRALPLEQAMHAELESSWIAWHGTENPKLQLSRHDLKTRLLAWKAQVQDLRTGTEEYVLESLNHIPDKAHHSRSFRLLRYANDAARPSLLDMLRCAAQPHTSSKYMRTFNPYLTDQSCARLWEGVLVWLQLCVLEDKLERLSALVQMPLEFEPTLVKELLVKRTWDPRAHPEWLAFEAEGQLQIRPVQHWVASYMLEHPGEVVQLNMGEGKTR
mmetsp:Transcript_13081/g.38023  ORF Transcript_13081/g.38023 Transcript_13081/m.38023 type:complete len:815 (+) Transcript_13081:3697-6141(+)